MKKNTRKFEKSMRIIIRRIIDNQSFSEFYTDNPEPLCECIDREYIGGIVYGRTMNGSAHFAFLFLETEFQTAHTKLRYAPV